MKSWEQSLVEPHVPLRDALAIIDKAGSQMALVVDSSRRLLGTLSDGDVRRGLLKGMTLTDPVANAMCSTPTVARNFDGRQAVLAKMRQRGLHQIPIVDADGAVVGLEIMDDYFVVPKRDNWVVIMAGGLGSRLKELTADVPKPMLKVGSQPLLEIIIKSYAVQGFRKFWLAVNYKADQIESYFGDGSELGVDISYLREQLRLGTAGALSLLPESPLQPLVVTNADLLTKEDYGRLLDQHVSSGADATMTVRDYEIQVPFGVVREADGRVNAIDEKPIQRFVVSAGMYVLSPQTLTLVPRNEFFDMPSLFEAMIARGLHTRCHHIDGYWLDIGRLTDYEKANLDFPVEFR